MADLTQRVKYIVSVDAAELDKLNAAVATANVNLDALAKNFRAVQTTSLSASKSLDKFSVAASLVDRAVTKTGTSMQAYYQMNQMMGNQSAALAAAIEQLAQNMSILSRTAREAKGALNSATGAMTEHEAATKKVTSETEKSNMSFLRMFGKFQALKWIATQTFDALRDGAQSLDLDRVLGKQIDGFTEKLKAAKEATSGMVLEQDLKKTMALMSALGVPIENFAEQMGIVQKLAIRTGQDAKWLTESWGLAISRLSPRIADNLGITISLKDAYKSYGAQIGKASEELTKHEQILAMMNAMMERGKELTEGVDLTQSATVAVDRFENFFKNIWATVKEEAVKNVDFLDRTFEGSTTGFRRALAERLEDIIKWNADYVKAVAAGEKGAWVENMKATADAAKQQLDTGLALASSSLSGFFGENYSEMLSIMEGEFRARAEASFEIIRNLSKDADLTNFGDLGKTNIAVAAWDLINKRVEQNVDIVTKLGEKYKGVVSAADMIKIKEEALKEARSGAIEQLDRIVKNYGGVNEESIKAIVLARDGNSRLAGAAEYYERLVTNAITVTENTKAHVTAMTAEVAAAHELDDSYNTRQKLAEGLTLTQIAYNEAKANEAEMRRGIEKAWKEFDKAQEDGRGREELNVVHQLQAAMTKIDVEKEYWGLRQKAEDDYFKSFSKATKEQLRAEIARLQNAIDILDAMNNQIKAMQILTPIVKVNEDTIKSLQNAMDRLNAQVRKAGNGGGGGYELPKQSANIPTWHGKDIDTPQLDKMMELSDKLNKMSTLNNRWSPAGQNNTNTLFGISADEVKKQAEALKNYLDEMAKLRTELGDTKFFQMFDKEDLVVRNLLLDNLTSMGEHFEKLIALADPIRDFSNALSGLAAGMTDLFGQNYSHMVADLAESTNKFSEALRNNAHAHTLVEAAMPVVRSFTNNLIKDRRLRAGVEGAMETAAAWASFADFEYASAAAHAIAATMYFGVAGGAFRLPKGKNKEDKVSNSGNTSQNKLRDVHIHLDNYGMVYSEAERGFMIRQAIAASEREGM